MKKLLFYSISKISLSCFIMIMMVISLSLTAQDYYLSFTDGKQNFNNQKTKIVSDFQDKGINYFEMEYEFSGAYISSKKVEDTKYNFLNIDGFSKMTQVGAPAVPSHNDIIAIPDNAIAKVIILESKYEEFYGFMIHPALKPAHDTYGAPDPEFEIDEKIYNTDEFFPKNIVEIVNIQKLRGTPLAITQTRPVQFNPVTGKIRVYSKIKYKIEFSGSNKSFNRIATESSLHFTNLLKKSVVNNKFIPDGIKNSNNSKGGKEYIIITHSEYKNAADSLAKLKRQLGYSVEVVSQSEWTASQVKTAIH